MEWWGTLIAGLVGAGAAIFAPAVQRAMSRRSDEAEASQRRRHEVDDRFFSYRLEVFARYMQCLSRVYESCKALIAARASGRGVDRGTKEVQMSIDALYIIETDVRLLAQGTIPACNTAIEAARTIRDKPEATIDPLKAARIEIERVFTDTLGGREGTGP